MSVESVEAFERRVDEFLAARVPLRATQTLEWGHGDDAVDVIEERVGEEERAEVARAKAWRAQLIPHGFHWITGPAELGGAGLTEAHQRAYHVVAARYDVPNQRTLETGYDIIAPGLFTHGSTRVREEIVPAIHRGDEVACQLFSEPGAGSDLAGASTRAVKVEGGYRVTGQKIWTSNAHFSDWGELLARTDPAAPKHAGLSMLVVDMHADGVDVRQIRQMTGGTSFNEVFLDDVFVADELLLGEEGDGWTVARTTLSHERATIGENPLIRLLPERLAQLLDNAVEPDDLLADRMADLQIDAQVLDLLTLRQRQVAGAGQQPGPEMSLGKLLYAGFLKDLGQLALDALGPRAIADDGSWGTYAWRKVLTGAPGLRIAGGTDEIMRNIIAERVLGLPREASS